MRILMPFFDDLSVFDRYLPQMESISKRLGPLPKRLFHIAYAKGRVKQEWKHFFSFHKVEMPHEFLKSTTLRLLLYAYGGNKLHQQVKDLDVDLVYTLNSLWQQEFSRKFSRKMKVPCVVRLRGDFMGIRKKMVKNQIKRRMLDHVDTRCLKQADLVIPISSKLAKAAEECGVDRGKISEPVPLGVNVEVFRPMDVESSSDFTVGYAGRISPEKRVDRLVKIAEKLPDVHFLIAGKRTRAQRMPTSVPANVEYLGELPFQEMPVFYNKVDLLVLPSFSEGFGCVVLEAYACGKPVLFAREAVQEEFKIFGSVAEIEDFELEIRDLKNSDLKALSRDARSYVEKHYTWEKFNQSMIELLKSVVD